MGGNFGPVKGFDQPNEVQPAPRGRYACARGPFNNGLSLVRIDIAEAWLRR